MVQKRFFHDENDGGFRTPLQEPKRIHSYQTDVRERTLYDILEPLIRKAVREETECAISKIFHSSSSSSVNEAGTSAGCSLQLRFANKLPNRIFTNNILKAEDDSPLKVLLCGPNSKTVVESHPLSSARVDIVVLSGLFATDKEDWTEEEFGAKILREREGKRPLIAGKQSIVLKNGIGLISEISITDNSSWIPNKKFILGAKISVTNSGKPRVREARSHPFSVKDSRGEGYTKHYPPKLHDEVWRLEKIRKDGKLHDRLTFHGILTVKDFLWMNELDQPKLRQILGLGGMYEKMWRKILDHAKTCKMDDYTIARYPNGCHEALAEDPNQSASLNSFDGQPAAKLASNYQQSDLFIASNPGFQQLEPTIMHPQGHLQIHSPMTNTNSNEENLLFQMQNNYTDEASTSTAETNYVIGDLTFLHNQDPFYVPTAATIEQGNTHFLLPSSSYAADSAAEPGIFSHFLDHSVAF